MSVKVVRAAEGLCDRCDNSLVITFATGRVETRCDTLMHALRRGGAAGFERPKKEDL